MPLQPEKHRRESYGRFLGFISVFHPDRLSHPPEARIDRTTLAEYVAWRRTSCEVSALGYDLQALRDALKLIAPSTDWSWLLSVAKRMTAAAPAQRTKYHLITSDRLYLLGLELMDGAVAEVSSAGRITKAQAFRYRDGLIIALLAMIPLRSGTLRALRIGQHLVKVGGLWALDIPAADTKSRRALDYPISEEISERIDLYLEQFRSRIPGADKHAGLWASNKGRPMVSNGIYLTVWKRTKKAFGFRRQSASIPSCSGQLLVQSRSPQCEGCQRPAGSRVLRHDAETLHYGSVAFGRSCFRTGDRCGA